MLGNLQAKHTKSSFFNEHRQRVVQDNNNPSHIVQSNPQFQTTFKQSGYIVGPPIAYTDQPTLPPNFRPFSPERNNGPLIFNTIQGKSRDASPQPKSITFTHQPPNRVISSSIPISNHVPLANHIVVNNSQTVPRILYDRCATECKNWETKYNQLYLKYMNVVGVRDHHLSDDEIREENNRLKQKIRQLQTRQRALFERVQSNFTDIVNKYKDSTMKQCMLLMDRYRLECKHAERQN